MLGVLIDGQPYDLMICDDDLYPALLQYLWESGAPEVDFDWQESGAVPEWSELPEDYKCWSHPSWEDLAWGGAAWSDAGFVDPTLERAAPYNTSARRRR